MQVRGAGHRTMVLNFLENKTVVRSEASERLRRAASAVVEILENRCLLSVLVPGSSVLVFNDDLTSGQPSRADTLTITNTGSSPLTLGGWSISADPSDSSNQSADFHVTSGQLPASLAAGASAQITVDFTATAANTVESALLNISSSDATSPTTTIQLHGLGTNGQYGYNEPSLANILTAFDIPTNIGVTNPANSQYPQTPSPSSQEVPMQRLVAAGTGPVTITPLASFNSSVPTPVRFGYYTPGDPTDATELFAIGQSDAQAVNPTTLGATSFNPGNSPFGLYAVFPGTSTPNGSLDVHYSEDALNTLDPSHPEKFRFFPMETANGTIVANTYIVAAEDYNDPTYNSFTNFVGIISNVKPAPDATHAAVLGLTNLSGVPSTTQLAFNRIQNPNPADPAGFTDIVHDTNTLQINNTGDQTLVISGLTLSDTTNWQIVNPPTYPLDIAPGGSADVTVKFIAQTDPPHTNNQTNDSQTTNGLSTQAAGGVWDGTLTLYSNDPVNPSRTVNLAGYWQDMSENENEPGLQTIINSLFGYGTNISNTQQPNYPNNGSQVVLYGEEVASGLWQSADPTLPVTVRQIDAFHNQFSSGTEPATLTGWYAAGNSGNINWLFQQQPGESQSLLPTINGSSTAPAMGSFTPSGAFGFNIDGESSQDSLNTTDIQQFGRSGHAIRFYPVRDSSGNLVPNQWLMVMDYQNGQYDNSDFQDNVYLVSNIHPQTQAPAPKDAQATAEAAGILLQWQPVPDSSLEGYNVYRSSSVNGPYTKLNNQPVTVASYVDTTAPPGSTSFYRITAVDTAGESEGAGASAAALSSGTVMTNALAPTADAYVQDGASANANFGSAPDLQAKVSDPGFNHESYIAFNLAGTSGSVTSATLNLFGEMENAGAAYTVNILPTAGNWSENTITWNTKPADGTQVLASATVSGTTGQWYSFNLTSYIQSQLAAGITTISLAIEGGAYTSGGYADFNSRQAATNTPQLAVTTSTGGVAPAAPAVVSVNGTTSSSVSLSWAPSSGATSYVVLRKGPTDSGFSTIATPTGTSYTDTTVVAGTTYSYEIEAANAGLTSGPTSPVTATTGAGATASFVKSDTTTQGNWTGVYGADGYEIFSGPASLPSYAQVSTNGNSFVWQSSTTDGRAPQVAPGSSSRIASCLYSSGHVGGSFTINLNLTDGKTHQVALYLLDWDQTGRAETVQVTDASSGAVLSTQNVSNFSSGAYLVWNLTGNVKITLTCTAPVNAVASGLFFGPVPAATTATATFVKADTTTSGTWTNAYGADGYSVFNEATSLPTYAQVTPINAQPFTWANPTTDTRALQDAPAASGRAATCYYTPGRAGSSFALDVNLTDGNTHQVALYLLDWDTTSRTETVQITDATSGAVLNTQNVSNFSNGTYLVWTLSGHVKITVTCTAGLNGVASGLFFGGAAASSSATASFVKADTTTRGNWTGSYGADGYSIINDATNLPSYAQVTPSGGANFTWAASTADSRALLTAPSSSSRIASCYYAPGGVGASFSFDVNLTDGKTHAVGLYFLDWDSGGRAQTVQIADASSGAVLSTQSVSNFSNGTYLVWNLSGHVKITVTCTAGLNAVVSGLFFGNAPASHSATASFVKSDTTTSGNWGGAYGSDGYGIFDGPAALPSYAQLSATGANSFVWQSPSTDPRTLQTAPGSSTRIASCYYTSGAAGSSFTLNLNLTDGNVHQVALYLLDFDNRTRAEIVQITDAATGAVLSTQNASNFYSGNYLVWNLSGNVKITLTCTGYVNAVASGIFFAPPP